MAGWSEADGALVAERVFPDFAAALAFVNRVGAVAEEQGHHPDIALHGWNRVTLRLTTHSAGGVVTEHDRRLAARIDALGEA